MEKIDWNSERFQIGHAEIDLQHQHLMQLINELVDQLDQPGDILNDLVKLVEYARDHFQFEEELLEASQYSDIEQQHQFHNQYLDKMDEFIANSATLHRRDIVSYLTNWWEKHILIEDMRYKGKI